MTDDFTSILDKTDWRKSIHKALEEATFAIGKEEEFYHKVEVAISAMKGSYPNWDANKEIDTMLFEVHSKYDKVTDDFIKKNRLFWCYPWNKNRQKIVWQDAMYKEILEKLKNIAGEHRMLLWGVRKVPGGEMGNGDVYVSSDKDDSGAF